MRGMFKSSRFKEKQVKVPGGRLKKHFKETKPNQQRCGACGAPLPGIPRFSATQAKNAPKSQKRPERPFGGNLCGRCMKNMYTVENIMETQEKEE